MLHYAQDVAVVAGGDADCSPTSWHVRPLVVVMLFHNAQELVNISAIFFEGSKLLQ